MANRVLSGTSRGIPLLAVLLAGLFPIPAPARGQDRPIVIRMASPAPQNSPWHDALMIMRDRWREASGGRVDLRVIPNAQGGEEDDVLRKMRIGQFQAGGFTLAGLQYLTTATVVLAIPLLMETQEELHRVRDAVGPYLEEMYREEGFELINWVDLGWMQFFTQKPDPTPDAVRSYTYVEWGDNSMLDLWREAGFRPGVKLNLPDITVQLGTGMINAINTAPLVVYSYQWFTELPYMIDVHWAPLSGATLVDRRTWERIPADLRPELLRIAREAGDSIAESMLQLERDGIEAMKSHGMTVVTPPPEVMDDWRRLFRESWDQIRGKVVPEELFDRAVEAAGGGRGS